jgi:hypothetical protein
MCRRQVLLNMDQFMEQGEPEVVDAVVPERQCDHGRLAVQHRRAVEVGLLEVFFDDQDDADVGEKLHRQCRPLFKARKLCQVAQALLGNDISSGTELPAFGGALF